MLSVAEIIKRSFVAWASNFIIVLPFVFIGIASAVLAIPLLTIFWIWAISLNPASLIKITAKSFVSYFLSSPFFIPFLIFLIIFIIALIFVSAYFGGGAVGMAKEIWQGKKISLGTMHRYGKYFLFRYAGALVILSLIGTGILAAIMGLFALPFLLTRQSAWLLLVFPGFVLVFLLLCFFILTPFYMINENLSIAESIGKSCCVVKRNYVSFLGILFLFFVMQLGVGLLNLVPFAGLVSGFVNLLIFVPVQTLAMMLFAIDRSKKFRT